MKRHLLTFAFGLILTGCGTVNLPTQDECVKYSKIYKAYVELVKQGKWVDNDTITNARIAGEFLLVSCGWLPTESGSRARSKDFNRIDANGVLILSEP